MLFGAKTVIKIFTL